VSSCGSKKMPSDLPTQTDRIDEAGFPIAIGFQPEAEELVEVDSHCYDCDLESSDQGGIEDAESLDSATPSDQQQEPLAGYELVEDMMRRQDEVLSQLDDLNTRIESAIQEVSAARKSEIVALEAESNHDSQDLQDAPDTVIIHLPIVLMCDFW